jgi:hypothetical protein
MNTNANINKILTNIYDLMREHTCGLDGVTPLLLFLVFKLEATILAKKFR